jgi:hypothetical protein
LPNSFVEITNPTPPACTRIQSVGIANPYLRTFDDDSEINKLSYGSTDVRAWHIQKFLSGRRK